MTPFYFDVGAVAAGATSTVQLCRTGSFYRADQGKFKVTRGMLEAMAANAQERGVDIALKLTHEGGTFAAGWVAPSSLTVRPWRSGYGLFGQATWANDGNLLLALKAGRSKYISPEIVWSDRRMASSPRGHAGEPIGPSLVGAALVLDPFFSMDAVQFARALRLASGLSLKPQRYNMDQKQIDAIKALLIEKGLPEETAADAVLALMSLLMGAPAEEAPEEEMAAEAPLEAAAAPAIQAARDAQFSAMAKRLEALEAEKKGRDKTERDRLYAEYDGLGKLRFADKAEAKKLLDTHGAGAFAAAYGRVPALVDQAAPPAPAALPTATSVTTGDATHVEDSDVKAYLARPGNEALTYRAALKALSAERKRSN
jgi:hypothetical protein